MAHFMSIRITICEESALQRANIYYHDCELNLELAHTVSYEQGMKELRKLEKRLNRIAELTVNQYDPSIAYKTLYGYIDRE